MPELPEVETIRRGLENSVLGARIEGVNPRPCRVFQCRLVKLSELAGQRILAIRRRGKFLVLQLDRHCCIIHLGMTGQVTVRDPSIADSRRFIRQQHTGLQRTRQHAPDQHTHLRLLLEDGREILMRDPRKFGRVHVLEREERILAAFFSHLGLEPLSQGFTLPAFLEGFRNRSLRIKSLLLDQSFVAGIGNIYADEALFEAAIHPLRRVRGLRRYEKVRLFRAIPKVLDAGILFGGTSLKDFINSEGEQGTNQEQLHVYGRQAEPCGSCAAPIEKIVVSQRGTHFCPVCQPRHGRQSTRNRPARSR